MESVTTTERVALIHALWTRGWTQADIARELGLTRQRVAQLFPVHSAPPRDWIRPSQAKVLAEVGSRSLQLWLQRGEVNKSPSGLVLLDEILAHKQSLMHRKCRAEGCDSPINTYLEKVYLCPRHAKEANKYRYPFYTKEQKARHHALVEQWRGLNQAKYTEAHKIYRKRWQEKVREA